jgi:hypothetical protein
VEIVANGPHHDLAGVEANPDLHLATMHTAHRFAVAADRVLHGECGIASPDGVVFMRNRRPKQGHNAIAHNLVHSAFVAMHGRHHALQHGIEELARLLRVAVGHQLHGAFKVRKQHRDLLALAFEGSSDVEDFLGQMCGNVGARRTPQVRRGGQSCDRLPSPDEHLAILIGGQMLGIDELGLQILEVFVIQIEPAFERSIGHTLFALEQLARLCQDLIEGHSSSPPTYYQSVRALAPHNGEAWEHGAARHAIHEGIMRALL